MTKFFDRLGRVVKAEWNARFGDLPDDELAQQFDEVEAAPAHTKPPRAPAVSDTDGALRVLELQTVPTLDVARAQYRMLAHRYHPRTRSQSPDQVHAAQTVLDALTDAIEVLEEHLLPIPGEQARR